MNLIVDEWDELQREMESTPRCSKCSSRANMVKHEDGEWVCHGTHPIDETPDARKEARK